MKEGGHVIPLEEKSPRRQHKKVLALFLSAIQHFLRRCSVLISVYVYFLPLKRLNCSTQVCGQSLLMVCLLWMTGLCLTEWSEVVWVEFELGFH